MVGKRSSEPDDAAASTPPAPATSAGTTTMGPATGTAPGIATGTGQPVGDTIGPRVRRAVHDLRQPVQAMRLFVHLLSTRLQRDEDRALVVKLDEALENIEGALRGLMSSVPPATPPQVPPGDDGAAPR